MKRILLVLLTLLILATNLMVVHAETTDIIDAPAYILIDQKTGQVLAEKNADQKMYPASTTKVMTAVLAIEKGDFKQLFTASRRAADPGDGGMNIGISEGEQVLLEDLINAMMIKSANETANIIAENIGITYEGFIDMMNKKAAELGALNTHFVNPNGMHEDDHYTTARDLAKISRYAMTLEKFREVAVKSKYDMRPTNKHEKWDTLYTINKMLKNLPAYKSEYFTAIGVKNGYTSVAGHNLVESAVNTDGMELLAVVLGVRSTQVSSDIYTSTKKLLEYGFKNYSIQKLAAANEVIKNVPVEDGEIETRLDIVTQTELSAVLPVDQDIAKLDRIVEYLNPVVQAPVSKGQVMGYVEYKKDGVSLGKVNLIAAKSVEKSTKAIARDTVQNVASSPILKRITVTLLVLPFAFIVLRVVLRKVSRAINSRG